MAPNENRDAATSGLIRRPPAQTLPLIGRDYGIVPLAALGENYNDCRRSRKRVFHLYCSAEGGFWPFASFAAAQHHTCY
jgi:hypothetical protein